MPVPGYIDATRISPRLYVGSRPRTGVLLHDAGFHALVLCALPSEYDQIYGASGQPLYARFAGLYVIGCQLDDSAKYRPDPSSIQRARDVAREVAIAVLRGKRVLLTCMEGRNRSAFVAALALHELSGRSGPDCEAKVRAERGAQLGPDKPVLFNTYFRAILATVEQKVPDHPRHRVVSPGAPQSSESSDSNGSAS